MLRDAPDVMKANVAKTDYGDSCLNGAGVLQVAASRIIVLLTRSYDGYLSR